VVRFGIPRKGFYDDIGFTRVFHGAAGDNTPGITIENDFKHDLRRIGGGAFVVVVKSGVAGAEVQPVDEVIQGMFERTGYELFLKVYGKK
jgi:hypothetical protein